MVQPIQIYNLYSDTDEGPVETTIGYYPRLPFTEK